jgi:NAD(P)-dependent dehydrogenase (short-subunit alcohol dehydrogenase family)
MIRAMTQRIAAITGAGGALGSAVARNLHAAGYALALFDTDRGKARLDALAGELGGVAVTGDFGSPTRWAEALDTVGKKLGSAPSHAVLVAGGWAGGAPLHASNGDACEAMMKLNVQTTYASLQALLPAMVTARHGSVVVVGSRAAVRPWTSKGAAAYAASKAAVVALAETVAAEVLEHGVRVNAILPSTMDTPANRQAMPDTDPSKWVSLESAAEVIGFLLSDASRDVSGAAIPVYGRA